MPDDKKLQVISRRAAGIYNEKMFPGSGQIRRPDGTAIYRAGNMRTQEGDRLRGDINAHNKYGIDISDWGLGKKGPSSWDSPEGRGLAMDNKIIQGRDAHNANVMRQRMAGRAADYAAKTADAAVRGQIASGRRAAVGKGLMRAGGLAATAFLAGRNSEKGEADTGSYGTTALGGSNGSYAGQGKMSKALGVKNTKPGM